MTTSIVAHATITYFQTDDGQVWAEKQVAFVQMRGCKSINCQVAKEEYRDRRIIREAIRTFISEGATMTRARQYDDFKVVEWSIRLG